VCLVYVFQLLCLCLVFVFQVLKFAEQRYQQKMNASVPDSQLDAIGCLPMAIPFVLLSATANEDQAASVAPTPFWNI
jgi:hypothetical protein